MTCLVISNHQWLRCARFSHVLGDTSKPSECTLCVFSLEKIFCLSERHLKKRFKGNLLILLFTQKHSKQAENLIQHASLYL